MHALVCQHLKAGEKLYGVVDSARDRELAEAAWAHFELKRWSLFGASGADHMANVSPYLVAFDFRSSYPHAGSGYLDLWANRLGSAAGILLISSADARSMWEHLGTIFKVADEHGHNYFFRFYDPRVLRVFLPTCSTEQSQQFFGPVRRILVEAETAENMLVCGASQEPFVRDLGRP